MYILVLCIVASASFISRKRLKLVDASTQTQVANTSQLPIEEVQSVPNRNLTDLKIAVRVTDDAEKDGFEDIESLTLEPVTDADFEF